MRTEILTQGMSPDTLEWMDTKVGGDTPRPRSYHSSILCDSRLFVYGGSADGVAFDELFILELGVNAYLALQSSKV